ncbi:SGNH/GDSL hydrolase family protein [Bacillus sp. V3B]|uniref:SGNH/GDSL hydrolase family protein n=1 Tax=Bacillus sp. V3B TaxID=2804915 RepID=UPI00210D5DA4|nr:SGNH/GDSL hydrolase family protein [Bacillus sp. V3B]MCQ6274662.1 SGNH/GDSL hydrolase family protein [Bacillus sp. V3B]
MKTLIRLTSVTLVLACVALLFFGQIHWNEKTDVTAINDSTQDKAQENKATNPALLDHLLGYTVNWPAESVDTFQAKVADGKTFNIAFLGSNSLGEGESSWPQLVKGALEETYGDHIEVTTYRYNLTSHEYTNQNLQDELIEAQPDLVLFEPFTLKDNGLVTIDDSLRNVSSVMEAVEEEYPDSVFILQPPHPLYNATYYPIQVGELKKYAEAQGIVYLNHWEAWPDPATEEIKEYLEEDSSQPSAKGHELWAEVVIDYLIAGE